MRVNFFNQVGNVSSGVDAGVTGTMTGPLILHGNPVSPLEAAPKQYVDSVVNSLNATHLKKGVLSVNRLPAFTGDVISATGTGVFTLGTSGVTAGTYTKATVNDKGRVIAAGSISNDDIPTFGWGKIASGKPTTLSGYGIKNALSVGGGVLNGVFSLTNDPVSALHAVTKQYVDTKGGASVYYKAGDVIRRTTATTPDGFLRCNGGELNKTTYAALYNVLGDTFSYDLQPGSGQPWRQQYQINSEPSADITGWTTGTSLPEPLTYSQAIVTKNRVYLLGGDNNTTGRTATVYTAPINSDDTLGTWSTGTSLPGPLTYSQAIVTKNRVYLLGGINNGGITSTVYTAPINSDGTLGTWTTGTSLPVKLAYSQAIVTRNRVYLLGGYNNTTGRTATVYTAPINSDGTLGTWTTGTSLPGPLTYSQAIVTKNRVYLLGGVNNSGGITSIVYTAPINSDGTLGTWTTGTSLPEPLAYSQAIVTKNRVYLLGGVNNTTGRTATVYTAPINSDGTLGTWTTGTSLPGPLTYSQAIVTKNRVYLLGGINNGGITSIVYTAPFSGGLNDYSPYYDGTIQPISPGMFQLPDLSAKESSGEYYFIKT